MQHIDFLQLHLFEILNPNIEIRASDLIRNGFEKANFTDMDRKSQFLLRE